MCRLPQAGEGGTAQARHECLSALIETQVESMDFPGKLAWKTENSVHMIVQHFTIGINANGLPSPQITIT